MGVFLCFRKKIQQNYDTKNVVLHREFFTTSDTIVLSCIFFINSNLERKSLLLKCRDNPPNLAFFIDFGGLSGRRLIAF